MARRSLAEEISLKNKTAVVTGGEYNSGGKIDGSFAAPPGGMRAWSL
jgi:hypothetical protein